MKKFLTTLILIGFVFSCSSDEDDAPPPASIVKQYTLSVTAGEGGSVSTTGGTFSQGTEVSITATPSSGFTFSQWSNGSTTNPLTLTVNSNTNLTASFVAIVNSYTLTVSAGEGGTVSTEGGEYEEGTEVTITATPDEGYQFVGWEGSDSTENSITITMGGDLEISAIFERTLFISKAERYSDINETTGYFSKQKSFLKYISLEEAEHLFNVTGHRFDNFDAISADFNNDGLLDLFWFGMSDQIWAFGGGSHHNGKYFIISDYFSKTAPYDIIEYDSVLEFAAAGIEYQDIDGDNSSEILIYSTNIHQKNTSFITNNLNQPEEKGVVVLKINESFELESEYEIGIPKTLHRGTSGDIDNDGDIDILNFPTGHPDMQTLEEKFPTILYNDGNGNFHEDFIFKNKDVENYYWSLGALSVNFFDIDADGNLDLLFGDNLGTPMPRWPEFYGVNRLYIEDLYILWGDGTGKFNWDNKSIIEIKNELNFGLLLMGMGFTDYDLDGDIDLVLDSTRNEYENGNFEDRPATKYYSYILTLLENKGNRTFEDVTVQKIEGYYHIDVDHLGDMGEMMLIDKDDDGDFDLVPKDVKVFCCLNIGYNYTSDLYWENVGGSFVRRIND